MAAEDAQAEVDKLELVISVKADVIWLDICVSKAKLVNVPETVDHAQKQASAEILAHSYPLESAMIGSSVIL